MRKCIIICLFFLLISANSKAAIIFHAKSEMLNPKQVSDPHPAKGDVVLPMPGGLNMTLRPVCLPAAGYLDASEMQQGVQFSAESQSYSSDRSQYAEQMHSHSLSAPFELNDIPIAWGNDVLEYIKMTPACMASGKNGIRPFMYFLGKYEISRGQWRAVMEQDKNFTLEPDDYLPKNNISWFDVMEFTRRYSEWLMQNKPEFLPFFKQEKRHAFIRLPSEGEWEYAARGGHSASPAERSRTTLHPIPQGADYRNYIVSRLHDSTLVAPSPIGSRKPNGLGLYDMLGNCSEMILSPFQLVSGGKLTGCYGGFVIKGGSWRAANEDELHPGHRLEAAWYVDGKAQARDDMGFRIALGSILTPKDRRKNLFEEWKSNTSPKAAQGNAGDDVRSAIRIAANETENAELKRKLAQAESIASAYHEKVNENENRMIRETLLGALFSLETIANYASRCYQLICLMDAYGTLSEQKQAAQKQEIDKMQKEIKGFIEGIQNALFYYMGMMREAKRFSNDRLFPQLEKVSLQFAHDDGFSRSMNRRIKALKKHLEKPSQNSFGEKEALKDILPEWLLKKVNPYW